MDAEKVFVLVLSVLSLGTIIYLHWMSVRARRDSPAAGPETDRLDGEKGQEQKRSRKIS
jgi:cbb3-type cytochrome oxidase subunit 3